MNDAVKRTTLSEGAYEAIRRKIITGVLAPSSKLVVATLANGLDLSATPINEALAALEREGLVSYLPHRGYFVSSVTPENVEEVYSVREVFELLAVRFAAQQADRPTIERLGTILQQTGQSVRSGDTTTFSDLDLEFHRVIWSSTNNPLAVRIGELIGGQIRLLVATTARAPGRFRGAYEEHCEVYRAIKNKDPGGAVVAMRKHIRTAKVALKRAALETSEAGTTTPAAQINKRKTPTKKPARE
jgi:DNA-binding GntR family transcriptional regulator